MKTICECWNCGHRDEYENLPSGKKLRERLFVGETYTDVECPECGHLCFPDEPPLSKAAPDLLEALKELIAANEEADAAFSRYRGSCEDDPHFTAKQKRMEYARGRQDRSRESARAAIAKATQKSS